MPGQRAASARSASRSKAPSGEWAMTAFGMPCLRMSVVSARVSTPVTPMTPRAFSQPSSRALARKFDCSEISARMMAPTAADAAAGLTTSMSSSLTPTTPMCGKVKVTICAA